MCVCVNEQRGRSVLIAHRKLSGHLLSSLVTAVVAGGCPFCDDEGYSKPAGGCGGGQEV